MNYGSEYEQNLIMQDVYIEILDYIQNHDFISINEVLKIYGGIGYTDNEIKFLYNVAVKYIEECEELNNRKQK